jgi:hypothetical protein
LQANLTCANMLKRSKLWVLRGHDGPENDIM